MLWILVIYKKHRLHNSLNLLRIKRKGYLVCPNGFRLYFGKRNYRDIKRLFEFSVIYGVNFSKNNEGWHYEDNVLTLPNGIRFYVNRFDPLIFAETFLNDVHFSDFDLNHKIVIQAGGFIGDTALYYAQRGAKVFSFEPDINSFNQAIENIKLNPQISDNIVMKNWALGRDGEIEFPIIPDGSGGSSSYATKGRRTVKVNSVSVQSILKGFNIEHPYLLDLDIKGNEFDVVKDQSLSKFELIRIEYSANIENVRIGNRNDLVEKLKYYGFKNIRIFKHNDGNFDLSVHGTIEAKKTATLTSG